MTLHLQRPWRPLLSDTEAEVAISAARQIGDAMRATPSGKRDADAALFLGYLELALPGEGYAEAAERRLDSAIAALHIDGMPQGVGLHSGFTWEAWVTEHLAARIFDFGDGDANEVVDATLHRLLDVRPWPLPYDLISGLVGMGVYALERLDRASGRDCLQRVVGALVELARRDDPGRTFWSDPIHLVAETARAYQRGYHDLGVAHGVPGVVGLLAAAIERGVDDPRAVALLDETVEWLLSKRFDPAVSDSTFGYYAVDGRPDRAARTAWCYGDPGIAAVLLSAARAVGNPAWEEVALAIARRSLTRPREPSRVVDASLCHGTAGLAQIYNRLYQATGDEAFADAARARLAEGLILRRPEGFAGFAAWSHDHWEPEPGFLCGAAGIGLTYLAAAVPIEPEWDRLLLASIPPTLARPAAHPRSDSIEVSLAG